MKKAIHLFLAVIVFGALFVSACSAPATQAAPPPVQIVPTQPAQAVVAAPTQQPAQPAQSFAPACPAAASCTPPDVDEKDTEVMKTYCVKKVPYQNILVPPGTVFEVLDTSGEFECQDTGTELEGKDVIACHGKDEWTYELKLSNPACSAGSLVTGTGQCQEGYGYNSAQNCCAPLAGGDSGSLTIKVNLGACNLVE